MTHSLALRACIFNAQCFKLPDAIGLCQSVTGGPRPIVIFRLPTQ